MARQIGEEVKRITGGIGGSAAIVLYCFRTEHMRKRSASSGLGEPLVCVGIPEGDLSPIAGAFPSVIVTGIKGRVIRISYCRKQ